MGLDNDFLDMNLRQKQQNKNKASDTVSNWKPNRRKKKKDQHSKNATHKIGKIFWGYISNKGLIQKIQKYNSNKNK